jgi:hypothetical protein
MLIKINTNIKSELLTFKNIIINIIELVNFLIIKLLLKIVNIC